MSLLSHDSPLSSAALAKAINVASPDAEQSEEFLELANGCLCCSIKDTGIAAIEKLMQRKGAFDHILLETTGLADPGMPPSSFASLLIKAVNRTHCINLLAERRIRHRTRSRYRSRWRGVRRGCRLWKKGTQVVI